MEDAFGPQRPLPRASRRTLPNSRHPNNEQYGGERLSPRHPFRLCDARTTSSRVQRAAKHLIHASATCVRQHTATSQIALPTCEQSMHVLSPCALAAANALSRPCTRLHSRAHCLCEMPDTAHLPQEHKQGTDMRQERGGAPSTAGADEAPIRTAPLSAGSAARDHPCCSGPPLCCLGPHLRKTGRTRSSGVEGEFEGSSIGLNSHQDRTA